VCVLLATHWIALKQIMATITETERCLSQREPETQPGEMDFGIIRWLKHLNRAVEPEFMPYNHWPVWVEAQLDRDLCFFGKSRRG